MEENIMKVNLKVWRQAGPKEKGAFVTYSDVETTPDTSFLETLDILNESLSEKGEGVTVILTVPLQAPLHVSFTCAVSPMARQSL